MLLTLCQLAVLAGFVRHDPYVNAVPVQEWTFGPAEDRDYDRQPDDWTRRRGPGFPRYVKIVVDRERGHGDTTSLRFDANGGRATYYSPLVPIDPQHTFLFEARARSRGLEHDGGLLTISFLDHERKRVATFRSSAVSGTHADWVRLRVGPMEPPPTARFAVVACHLVPNDRSDVDGSCWFDDLRLLQTPRLTVTTNEHFVEPREPFGVRILVGGIRDGHEYRLQMTVRDGDGRVVDRSERRLEETLDAEKEDVEPETCAVHCAPPPVEIDWTIPARNRGHYAVEVLLLRNDEPILERETSFAVMDLVERRPSGEFGWSTPATTLSSIDSERFASIAARSGIHWLKHPVWKLATDGSRERILATSRLFAELQSARVQVVGVFGAPPADVRRKFADEWTGVAEVFTAPPETWSETLDPVLARFASHIRDWQLGFDDDRSFVGQAEMDEVLQATKKEIDRIGRDSRIGVRWTWTDAPPAISSSRSFLSMYDDPPRSVADLESQLVDSPSDSMRRWVVVAPLAQSKHTLTERVEDLVRRMVVAKAGGAEAIFAYDVFNEEHGLLRNDGSPRPLYLPWRTTATTLSGTRYLGRLRLPGGSTCHAFDSEGEGVLVVWNESDEAAEEGVVEEAHLGESAYVVDPFGRSRRMREESDEPSERLVVGPTPVFIRGLSAAQLEWRIRVRLQNGRVDSSTARQSESILGRNTFSQGVSGRVRLILPPEWEADPAEWSFQVAAGEEFELPTLFELPPNATLGVVPIGIEFDISGDRPYRFLVHREIEVGLGDLLLKVVTRPLPDGRLEVEQIVTNKIVPEEVLDLECTLLVPGFRRQRQFVTKLGAGEDRRFYFLPGAESFRGKDFWVRARQEGGRRVLNYRWTVGENWDESTDLVGE